jgi:hypothetical protein
MFYVMIIHDDDDFAGATALVLEYAGTEKLVESDKPNADKSIKKDARAGDTQCRVS